jgi:uncharacterized membrane protein
MALAWNKKTTTGVLWGGLVLSLAVNAFFLGATVTDVLRFDHHDEKNPRIVRMELRWLADRLSPSAVDTVQQRLDPLKPDILARFDRLRTLRTQLSALVAMPTPDRAAIDASLRNIRLEVGAMQEQIQTRTFDAVLGLPLEDRAPLANPPSQKDD